MYPSESYHAPQPEVEEVGRSSLIRIKNPDLERIEDEYSSSGGRKHATTSKKHHPKKKAITRTNSDGRPGASSSRKG